MTVRLFLYSCLANKSSRKYIVQEESWEEPYFDDCALVEDLEAVAQKMKPLLEKAFTNSFSYAHGFAANLLEAESEISDGIADWMEIRDGIKLQPTITHCLLKWEWLGVQKQGQDAFKLAKQIREWEEKLFHISLDDDAVIDFFSDLPKAQKKLVLAGMTAERDSSLWKYDLENTFSYWHLLLELAGFYQAPYRFKTEVSVDIVAQGDNDEILRGRINVLVLQGKLWIVLIESKKTTFDLELAIPQILAYMAIHPNPEQPLYGMSPR